MLIIPIVWFCTFLLLTTRIGANNDSKSMKNSSIPEENISNHLEQNGVDLPVLIIVSYDAFRYDYLNESSVPKMWKLRQFGTFTDYMINVFPTKTFPNHHTIATGLYPEEHGIIGNKYLDPDTKSVVNTSSYKFYHYNDKIVPIWRLNEDMGPDRHSGNMMWPGGDFSYQGKKITFSQDYVPEFFDWHQRIDTIVSWILDPKTPANLIMLYFDEPDSHGHAYGADSAVIMKFLKKLDNISQYLEDKLQANDLSNRTTIVHLSDHGLTTVCPTNFLNISQYLLPNSCDIVGVTPVFQITPRFGYTEDDLYKRLKAITNAGNAHFEVYRKSELPERWHYKNCTRTAPIIVVADYGYALDDAFQSARWYAQYYNFTITNETEFGFHGYDYTVPEMRPFFMVRGPRIKVNHKVDPFHTVDLYSFFCKVLEIPLNVRTSGNPANIQNIFMATDSFKANAMSNIGSPTDTTTIVLLYIVAGVVVGALIILSGTFIGLYLVNHFRYMDELRRRYNTSNQRTLFNRYNYLEAQHLLEAEDST